MIDDAAYRRFTALGRMLVDSGDMTPAGLRMINAVATEEFGKWTAERRVDLSGLPRSRCGNDLAHQAHQHIVGRQRYWCEGWA